MGWNHQKWRQAGVGVGLASAVAGLLLMESIFAAPSLTQTELRNVVIPLAAAQEASRLAPVTNSAEEIWKKSQSLRPQPSMDTTPIDAKVGDVLYKIPRNYVSNLHMHFPVLKVTYPGFKPLTEQTKGCFDPKLRNALGCTTIELNMHLSLPNKPGFENLMKLVHPGQKASPRESAYGYQIFDLGPENARLEIYRSESEDIFFTCQIFYHNDERHAVCRDFVSLLDGNAVWFFFDLNQISEIRKVEAGIRQLMSGFTAGASK